MKNMDRIKPYVRQEDLGSLSLRLLNRPAMKTPILAPEVHDPAPLSRDVETLSDPETEITDQAVVNLLAKLFHAFVHPESIHESVPLADITLTFDRFANRRRGADSLDGLRELRLELLRLSFSLCMLADLPKSAAIVREILAQAPDPAGFQGSFLGLDIGAGTGVLMLAQKIMADRAGFAQTRIVGLERNADVADRANLVMGELGVGEVVVCDATRQSSYAWVGKEPVAFVANETLPSQGRRLWKEDFVRICEAMFSAIADNLGRAVFFPDTLATLDRNGTRVDLKAAKGFAPDTDTPPRLLKVWGLGLGDGRSVPLSELGHEYLPLISPDWRPLLSHRW